MAEIPVERTGGVPWWAWLLGLMLLLGLIWFVYEMTDNDRDDQGTSNASTTSNANNTNTTATPVGATANTTNVNAANTGAVAGAAGAMMNNNAGNGTAATNGDNRITDLGVYAATQDKSSLAGREAQFSDARVVRIVGPRTFTVASGNEEFYVMLDDESVRGVGTQGKIDAGKTLNVTGRFERLQAAEINDIANNRFRGLTEQERAFLRDTQVYLQANQVGNLR